MRPCWLLLVVALGASCLQNGDVPCDDGRTCPKDYVCTPTGCASADQLKACDGAIDGTECSSSAGTGACYGGACVVAFCGNGNVEPPEVCDDGNQRSGDGCNGSCSSDESCGNGIIELDEECDDSDPTHCDQVLCVRVRCGNGIVEPGEVCDDGDDLPGNGCSFDCKSNETCGNGTIDYFAGEQCDDKNTRNVDGCSSTCRVEPMAWRAIDSEAIAPALVNATADYDVARNRLVVFSGNNATTNVTETAEVWELDGSTWIHRLLSNPPPARELSAIAYDRKRNRMVMFGGRANGVYPVDTWEYDGLQWTQVVTSAIPLGRMHHRLAYDAARERIVMFGGFSSGGYLDETWEYDGTNWQQMTPTASPPARGIHQMAYDAKRGRVVITGGTDGVVSAYSDVWEYDGTTWTARTLGGSKPAGNTFWTLTFDPVRGGCVLIGGSEAWLLDGTGWSLISSSLPTRRLHAAAFDTRRQRIVAFGGQVGAVASNETVELVGSAWSSPLTPSRPAARDTGAAFDSGRGKLILFGGQNDEPSQNNDTWELDGNDWKLLATTGTPPSARHEHAMAYDAARRRIVLFGGEAGPTRMNDTYEYNPETKVWSSISVAHVPPVRARHSMVYDSLRKRIVMYGGVSSSPNPTFLSDTWEYDGTDWTQIPTTADAGARESFGMAYDSVRQRTLLFGGTGASFLPLVFEYDGATWAPLTTFNMPSSRVAPMMAYDSGRNRIVLHGGGPYSAPLDDTWELVGDTWQRYVRTLTQEPPPGASFGQMVYDVTHGRMLLVGGYPFTYTNPIRAYEFSPTTLAPVEACTAGIDADGDTKAGCADDDCWRVCTPYCEPNAPAATCPTAPTCGDGACDAVEGCRICPADCGACATQCGDGFCDSAENATSCPGDCG